MANESLKLTLTQRQQQTLAPIHLQFVKMLEMNGPEVEEEVRQALDDNPALEAIDSHESDSAAIEFNESAEQLQMADYRSEDDIPFYRLEASNRSADDHLYEPEAAGGGDSLFTFLMRQLSENDELSERERTIAESIIGNIDSNGYIERTPAAIADDLAIHDSLDATPDEVRAIWQRIRALDPPGIAASDLRDSLLLQLARRKPAPPVKLATEIVRDYFDLFSLLHFDRLASLTGASRQQLKEAMDVIRTLHPKPGILVSPDDDRSRHITPDFFVEADGQTLTLSLLNHIPSLQIEQSFTESATATRRPSAASAAASAFIRQKRDEAASFIKALEMRQSTLFRIMSAIMLWQRDFFLTDDRRLLRPMVLKDIAAETGDDISVVSRATAGKYVATRQGVYSLKSLFNERRSTDTGQPGTAVVEARLREIIESEDKSSPMSDAEITSRLQDEGFDIARRTVAKYREKMGFPVGRLRKSL